MILTYATGHPKPLLLLYVSLQFSLIRSISKSVFSSGSFKYGMIW